MEGQDGVVVAGQSSTPAKFSRYRSVRRAASKNVQQLDTSVPSVPSVTSPRSAPVPTRQQDGADEASGANASIKRSMSRYRRQKASGPASDANPPPPVPVPTCPVDQSPIYRAQPGQTIRDESLHLQRSFESSENVDSQKGQGRLMNALGLDTRGRKLFHGSAGKKSSPSTSDQEYEERERHRREAMDRLTGGCTESPPSSSSQRPRTRGRAATNREPPRDHGNRLKEESQRHFSHEPKRRSLREAMKLTRSKDKPSSGSSADSPVEPSLVTQFPGVDAPVSAVNAGERKVLVYYNKASVKLSVTPSTSAHDILVAASTSLSREIDPPRFIVLEAFTETGLERALRRYEYVRDVMNSWAHDGENALLIIPAASLDALALLETHNVPAAPPADETFHLYYSQRPRKWDKRFVTLRADGQITVSKKKEASAKDQANVCHLSDFDIYSPTVAALSRSVKPPKKLCYAIKSQQKSSMFITTENFVHFFSTSDKPIADAWHRAVQSWRSWYLVNKLGAGQAESHDSESSRPGTSRTHKDTAHQRPFKPLLSSLDHHGSDEKEMPPSSSGDHSRTQQLYSRKRSSRDHGPPPASFPKSMTHETDLHPRESADQSPFASASLLGRTYTLRQKALKDREEREKMENEELFKQGLVGAATSSRRQFSSANSRPGSRSNTMTSAQAPPDLDSLIHRSQSLHQGKPLVDLTPVYQEPPQHTRKGRGVTVEHGMPLIDGATGLETPLGAVAVPPSKAWRRPPPPEPLATSDPRTRKRSNTTRSVSNQHRNYGEPSSPTGVDGEMPFAPNSLLARTMPVTAPTQGPPMGHGVATGDRNATKPMLDVSLQSPFAEGSLLRGL